MHETLNFIRGQSFPSALRSRAREGGVVGTPGASKQGPHSASGPLFITLSMEFCLISSDKKVPLLKQANKQKELWPTEPLGGFVLGRSRPMFEETL